MTPILILKSKQKIVQNIKQSRWRNLSSGYLFVIKVQSDKEVMKFINYTLSFVFLKAYYEELKQDGLLN